MAETKIKFLWLCAISLWTTVAIASSDAEGQVGQFANFPDGFSAAGAYQFAHLPEIVPPPSITAHRSLALNQLKEDQTSRTELKKSEETLLKSRSKVHVKTKKINKGGHSSRSKLHPNYHLQGRLKEEGHDGPSHLPRASNFHFSRSGPPYLPPPVPYHYPGVGSPYGNNYHFPHFPPQHGYDPYNLYGPPINPYFPAYGPFSRFNPIPNYGHFPYSPHLHSSQHLRGPQQRPYLLQNTLHSTQHLHGPQNHHGPQNLRLGPHHKVDTHEEGHKTNH